MRYVTNCRPVVLRDVCMREEQVWCWYLFLVSFGVLQLGPGVHNQPAEELPHTRRTESLSPRHPDWAEDRRRAMLKALV